MMARRFDMSKRIDNIVNELTNHIEGQIQTEVEMALGVKHRKDVGVLMFGFFMFHLQRRWFG